MNLDDLKDPELQAKLRDAKTPEELLQIAKDCGMELDDAQLDSIAGGNWCSKECRTFSYCPGDAPL